MRDRLEPYARYLRILGIEDAPAGLAGLQDLVLRHLCRVPFENISKLLLFAREGAGRPRTLAEFLDGIEHCDLGGTCHSNNPYLIDLLRHLGYDADLLGADMTLPNVHTCVRVRIDGVAYHVDVGYGAPFRAPLRLDRLPHTFREGALQYVLNRDGDACEMTVLAGQERRHGYIVHGPPRTADFFTPAVRDSFAPGRTFVSGLRLVRIFADHSVELWNRTLTIHSGPETRVTELRDRAGLKAAVDTELAMPRAPVERAVEILEQLTGKDFFAP